jgi:hypothetical protein
MYGRQLGADQPYFGPVPQGQTWETYESTQETLKNSLYGAAIVSGAAMIHPVLGLAAGLAMMIQGGSTMHQNKPKVQGG